MIEADVLIIGAGPAGATAALNLGPLRRVVVVERHDQPRERIGESLASAARRLLSDMGIWEAFLADGHSPRYAGRSAWGAETPTIRDSLADLDGPGWHLDRALFDARLRTTAIERGAALISPARVSKISRLENLWIVKLDYKGRELTVEAPMLIDASGRSSTLLRPFGTVRHARDRLICSWIHGTIKGDGSGSGLGYTESAPDGWWYSAPMPDGRRLLAWHTDADLPAASLARSRSALWEKAQSSNNLMSEVADTRFDGPEPPQVIAAHSSSLTPPAGNGWLAAGDAALSFDPLSSQGLFHALYNGLAAAETVDRTISGDSSVINEYALRIDQINTVYQRNLALWYSLERRWTGNEFWRRRQSPDLRRGQTETSIAHSPR